MIRSIVDLFILLVVYFNKNCLSALSLTTTNRTLCPFGMKNRSFYTIYC